MEASAFRPHFPISVADQFNICTVQVSTFFYFFLVGLRGSGWGGDVGDREA
ncbi:hypothetical protein RchiOBHm_Chr2g0085891 [Rosa chinensis]|uniref:Uncharacterized protein n=1 Tax=Rosa chinensis TaxID=74649 RepID=A0A2P6RI81_ROSCH|nr:hypothetical protein RchiOBHm_Chr2g0085891 [Rosa chinensis]